MKIDPKKFYWFRQMGNGTIRPMKYLTSCKCFVSTAGVFPGARFTEERAPTGFADPKDAMEKMKDDFEYFGRLRIDSRDPDIYAMFDSGSFGETGAKHLLVNGRKAAEYMVRMKIEDSNR